MIYISLFQQFYIYVDELQLKERGRVQKVKFKKKISIKKDFENFPKNLQEIYNKVKKTLFKYRKCPILLKSDK